MKKIITIITFVLFSVPVMAQLPQNHDWEVTLRNYMASLTTKDFTVPLKPITWDPSYAQNDEQLYKYWIALRRKITEVPGTKEFRMDPKYFLLSNIVGSDGTIHMRIGRSKEFSTVNCAWWAHFDYPGNPVYNLKAVKLRALIPAMVDMMMLTKAHEDGRWTRSDYAGGSLIMYAYPFYVGKDALPDSVQKAYTAGMLAMEQGIVKKGPTGIFGDMDSFSLVGMWYIAKTLNTSDAIQTAKDYSDRIINRWFYKAGYMGHGDGYDATYDGMDLLFLSWAASISHYQPLIDVLTQMSKLKSYLTLKDPLQYTFYNGPSHFSTATNGPVASDQGSPYCRDLSIAMLTDNAIYLTTGRGINKDYGDEAIPDHAMMVKDVKDMAGNILNQSGINSAKDFPDPSSYVPLDWTQTHWTDAANFAYDNYQSGFYQKLVQLKQDNSPLLYPPFDRKANFIQEFNNDRGPTFLSAKLGGYGVIIHTGRLSKWGGATGKLSGLSGGALSSFWTPQTGTVINGVAGGYQNATSTEGPDRWDYWQKWSVNTVTGVTADGKPFSEARWRFPTATYNVQSNSASVVAVGTISSVRDDGRTAPNNALSDSINYKRKFEVDPSGVTITSSLTSRGKDKVQELWEMIPVYLNNYHYGRNNEPTKILFEVNGSWKSGTTSLTKNATAVQLQRLGGAVQIQFKDPQSIKLSPERQIDYQAQAQTQNIMVDLLHNGGSTTVTMPTNVSVQYSIAPAQAKTTPIEQGSSGQVPKKTSLNQNYPNPFNPTTNISFSLSQAATVTLRIFDVLGRMVSSPIVSHQYSAGSHVVTFDGSQLSSGIYFYRLKAGNQAITKKMMLIK